MIPRPHNRRSFLKGTVAAGALAGLGDLRFLNGLPRVSAEEARLDPKVVRLDPDIEPLVRLLEVTPHLKFLNNLLDNLKFQR
jgi:hypothetical protein